MKRVSMALFAGMVGCAFVQPVSAAAARTFKEKTLYSFGNGTDGRYPGGFIDVNGILYGTTEYGGSGGPCRFAPGCGTVFSFDTNNGAEKVLYSFCMEKKCADGDYPTGNPVYVSGTLYGTTVQGGLGYGTAFSVAANTGFETVIHSFCSQLINGACTDGTSPKAGLIGENGTLYGTTQGGGAGDGWGTVFALDPGTGTETVLHTFCSQKNCTDGAEPVSALIDVNGTLYGTTLVGGISSCTSNYPPACGTVFSVDLTTDAETVVYSFCSQKKCTDGSNPYSAPIDVNNMLYGTTGYGGNSGCLAGFGCGTVFALDPGTGAESVLHVFCSQQDCIDGATPFAGLIEVSGTLYGTTENGGNSGCGSYGCGTVYSIDPNTDAENVVYAFCGQTNCTDGANPLAGLIYANGRFYGTTNNGGAYGYGTVFSLTP